MKFSVLLPTRNRLDLLKHAIETVRRQDYEDWEIVVSDNCSDDDIGGYVRSLGDPRIRYFRTERFVPVTQNWNNALAHATGDWILMLGDDDGLMRGYFSTARREIERHGNPDFVYTSAFLFAYPNALPGRPRGFVRTYDRADFLRSATEPFWLDRASAHALVRDSMRFKIRFGYNMQFALVSRALIERMRTKGDFYQSPYPDYYAMNAMMLVADRILVVPERLITIGISPKSFGYYYYNSIEERGVEFLKNLPDEEILRRVRNEILPGTNMNTSWLLAMETLLVNYGSEFDLSVRYASYRLLQAMEVLRQAAVTRTTGVLRHLLSRLTTSEKVLYGALLGPYALACAALPPYLRRRATLIPLIAVGTSPRYDLRRLPGDYSSMLEVFEKIDPRAIA